MILENVTVLKDASSTSPFTVHVQQMELFTLQLKRKDQWKANITIRGQYGISQLPDFKRYDERTRVHSIQIDVWSFISHQSSIHGW